MQSDAVWCTLVTSRQLSNLNFYEQFFYQWHDRHDLSKLMPDQSVMGQFSRPSLARATSQLAQAPIWNTLMQSGTV